MTILLVDDDHNDAQLVRAILVRQDSDITIIDAETCQDALRMAETAPLDAIVMDEKLARMPGSECVERLRENGYIGAFILLTGYPDTKIAVQAMMNGADNYLSKEDAEQGLYPALVKAVEKRRALVRMQQDTAAKEQYYQDQNASPIGEVRADIQTVKQSVAELEVKVEANNAKQFEMLLNMQARQDADRKWRFRQFIILATGILTLIGKMFKDYLEAVYK